MKGRVKWFSEQKGHGYLIGDDGEEYHIHIKEVKGVELPKNGDIVEFEEGKNQRGLQAKNLKILESRKVVNNSYSQNSNDERVNCKSCGKKIIPRIITYKPFFHLRGTDLPKKTICPYCGADYMHLPSNNCFIATAVYGDHDHFQVRVLRNYRDEKLLSHHLGILFVRIYYAISPPVAYILRKNKTLAKPVKKVLDKIIEKIK